MKYFSRIALPILLVLILFPAAFVKAACETETALLASCEAFDVTDPCTDEKAAITTCYTADAAATAAIEKADAEAAAAAKAATAAAAADKAAATGKTTDSTSTVTSSGKTPTLFNPLGETDPRKIIGRVIAALLSIIGSLVLLMFVYGGMLWITSMGEPKKVQKGKDILVWTVAGLGIIAAAYVITTALINSLTTGSAI
jgi:hypothetical protein